MFFRTRSSDKLDDLNHNAGQDLPDIIAPSSTAPLRALQVHRLDLLVDNLHTAKTGVYLHRIRKRAHFAIFRPLPSAPFVADMGSHQIPELTAHTVVQSIKTNEPSDERYMLPKSTCVPGYALGGSFMFQRYMVCHGMMPNSIKKPAPYMLSGHWLSASAKRRSSIVITKFSSNQTHGLFTEASLGAKPQTSLTARLCGPSSSNSDNAATRYGILPMWISNATKDQRLEQLAFALGWD